jgi:hypothetical protein
VSALSAASGALARVRAGLAAPRGEAAMRSCDRLLSPTQCTLVRMHRISDLLLADGDKP